MGRTENYIVELLKEILAEEPKRHVRFHWATGDVSAKTKRALPLPFDTVWPVRNLIIEINEDQHRKPTKFFDHRQTPSGVPRGKQRAIYDKLKRERAEANG